MIDKELSELKKDLPEYNIDNYKSGIYTKYSNKKNTRKIYFPKLAFISIILCYIYNFYWYLCFISHKFKENFKFCVFPGKNCWTFVEINNPK